MKIAIDARGINWYNGTGIGTYTENVLRNVLDIDAHNQYCIYWSGNNYEQFKRSNSKIKLTSRKHQRFFQQYYFPQDLLKEEIDLYHIPQNGIGLNSDIKCKKVVTIHDLIPYIMPETVGKGYLSKFLKEMPHILEQSDGIITVSEFSKRDILRFFPIDENKIFVTPLAADSKYHPMDKEDCKCFLEETYHITNPFILYLGGFSPRKNVDTIIKAFSKIHKELKEEYKLVIVGSYRDESQTLIKLTNELEMQEHILFTGFIPEAHLPLFYNACDAFVYPSLYEGFGLPPLEAMNCGTPIIASNLTSIPEVVGDGGILIDPNCLENLTDAMGNVLNNLSLRTELSEKALSRAKYFSWKETAKATLKAYKALYDQK